MACSPDSLANSIPFLRRYARALTGDQALGDQYVGITLEVIRGNPDRLPACGEVRRELFRVFHEVWAKTTPAHGFQAPGRAWDFVGRAARRERQLLLLVTVEGCSVTEASYILGIEEAEAHRLFRVAQTAVARHPPAPILIIEDEMLIAMDLEAIVESVGHRVCGIATGEDDALTMATQTTPRLILADVHLRGGESGIVAVRKILRSLDIPAIFITGYPQDLLTGMAPEPTFVITKPFQTETVVAAVSQALLTELPTEPDAEWRLRGRPSEATETIRLQPLTRAVPAFPRRPVTRPECPVQGSDHARRADASRS